jgi:hypothetical protein
MTGASAGLAFRKLGCRGQCRLNVECGAVDVAGQIELHRDLGDAQTARRHHRIEAGDGRELTLERGRDRGGHGLGRCTRKMPRHDDGRKIDLRNRGDGKQAIAEQAEDDEGQHQQRRHHRTTDA